MKEDEVQAVSDRGRDIGPWRDREEELSETCSKGGPYNGFLSADPKDLHVSRHATNSENSCTNSNTRSKIWGELRVDEG